MEYLLLVFAQHDKQEDFVKTLAEEIVTIVDSEDIKYYFGPESSIFVFKSKAEYKEVSQFFSLVLGSSGIVYFLTINNPEFVSYWLASDIKKHLFNIDEKDETTPEEKNEVQKFFFGHLETENYKCEVNPELFDEDFDDEIFTLKNKKKVVTLDELLDKINELGIQSLSEKEIEILNSYSK